MKALREHAAPLAFCVLVAAFAIVVTVLVVSAAVRVSEADRASRIARAHACESIPDYLVRALCIKGDR